MPMKKEWIACVKIIFSKVDPGKILPGFSKARLREMTVYRTSFKCIRSFGYTL